MFPCFCEIESHDIFPVWLGALSDNLVKWLQKLDRNLNLISFKWFSIRLLNLKEGGVVLEALNSKEFSPERFWTDLNSNDWENLALKSFGRTSLKTDPDSEQFRSKEENRSFNSLDVLHDLFWKVSNKLWLISYFFTKRDSSMDLWNIKIPQMTVLIFFSKPKNWGKST